MLQENKRDAACMYVHTYFDAYSDRHVLGLLLCAEGIALVCCAVLCCARGSTTYILVLYILRLLCTMLEDIHAGSRQFCMLASVVVWYVRNRKHCKARHSMTQNGTAGHSTAPHARHDTAWHRTALCPPVELAKLNGAVGCFFVLSDIRSWVLSVTRKKLD